MDTSQNPSQFLAGPQLSVHCLFSHFEMSSEAVSTDLDGRAHSRAPLQTLPSKLLVGCTLTHTHTNYESDALPL